MRDRPAQRPRRRLSTLALLPLLACASSASAHEGPPFPILMDQPAAGYLVSIWADPDIGDARFFIVLEKEGEPFGDDPVVMLWTEPTSGRLPRAEYRATRQDLRNAVQFACQPHFDQRDHWKIGVSITPPGGTAEELLTEVESTPPGFGAWDLAIYFFPFGLLGGLWTYGMLRRRARNNRRIAAAIEPAG